MILPRLEPISQWFAAAEYTSAIEPFLRSRLMDFAQKMGQENLTELQLKFVSGQLAMLNEILAMPQLISFHIKQIVDRDKQAATRNPKTGY